MTIFHTVVLAQPERIDTIIQLGESVFDIRIDADQPAQSDDTVAINSVPWVRDLMNEDPHLKGSIFHIRYLQPREGVSYPWRVDHIQVLAEDEIDIPEQFQPPGYQIAKNNGFYFFFPNESGSYFGKCSYNQLSRQIRGCSVSVRYVFDDQIRLFVNSVPLSKSGFPDFAAVATKAHSIVVCELDVTRSDSPRNQRPENQTSPETTSSCEDTIS